jgi:outer membrane protein assembly factor BamD
VNKVCISWPVRATVLALATVVAMVGCGTTKPSKRVADDPRSAYLWSLERIENGKCLHASETLRLLSLEQAGVPYVDSIIYHLARAYACLNDYALAQLEYERVVNSYPTSALVDDAAFGLAYAQFKQAPGNPGLDQKEAERAVRSLEDFIAIYPLSDRRDDALELLTEMKNRLAKKSYDTGRLYLKLRADSSAMIYFQQLWDEYTDSPFAARALWLLAEKERHRQNYPGAVQRYEQLIGVYPDAIEVKQAKMMLERIQTGQAQKLHDQARRDFDRGDLTDALRKYEMILAEYPEYAKTPEIREQAEEVRQELATDTSGARP